MSKTHGPYIRSTRRAIYLSSIFHEPLVSLFPLLPLILLKDLKATAFQIVILTMLKPLASIFSFYWSERISQNRHTLKWNILIAGLVSRLAFLPALAFNSVWLFIFASTLYMVFLRATIPAWMELLKRNLPEKIREKFFSVGSALGYAEGVLIAIGLGSLLDVYMGVWRMVFFVAVLFGALGVIVQATLAVRDHAPPVPAGENLPVSWKQEIVRPWKDCYTLMKERSDFRAFQWAFMVAGFGLMLLQPVIPIFFDQVLKVSYRDLMVAYSICKGLGFVAFSPFWQRALSRFHINRLTAGILWSFILFPICLILSLRGEVWFYIAHLAYGVAQAGSHLVWHLSGPIFSRQGQSSRFSSVSIVLVGVRGLLGPPLGGLLSLLVGPLGVFWLSMILFGAGGSLLLGKAKTKEVTV